MSMIVYNGMNIGYIIDEITITQEDSYNTSPYIGGTGSNTSYVSSTGRRLSFKSLCPAYEESRHGRGHRINDYIYLHQTYKDKVRVLTSPSESNINGNYILTQMEYSEDTGGNYTIQWEFQEVIPFNVTEQTFRVWGTVSSTSKTKKTTTKKSTTSNLSSNTKYLLKTCSTMKKGSNSKKCVKSLQKFLQSQGYYKGYKVDGVYATYTYKAVQSLQKKYKLKVTGSWDKNTRNYFQKKYKYPTTVIDKGVIGAENLNLVITNNKMVKL